jgi:hypothetical protein
VIFLVLPPFGLHVATSVTLELTIIRRSLAR